MNTTGSLSKHEKAKEGSSLKDLVIEIQLKGGSGPGSELNEKFVNVLEYEYAVKYLELIGVEPTTKNIRDLLKTSPLTSCRIDPGWTSSGWLADVLYIRPYNKTEKKEKDIEEKLLGGQFNEMRGDQRKWEDKSKVIEDEPKAKTSHLDNLPTTTSIMKQGGMFKADTQMLQHSRKEKKVEMNLNIENIKHRYLYPYALDDFELDKVRFDNIDLLKTKEFEFPLIQLSQREESIKELQEPICVTVDDLIASLRRYTKDFPKKFIPHVTENENINDLIHKSTFKSFEGGASLKEMKQNLNALTNEGGEKIVGGTGKNLPQMEDTTRVFKPNIHIDDIKEVLDCINSEKMARLIGLILHFVYWHVFGHFNQIPIDDFHKQDLFWKIQKVLAELEAKYKTGRLYTTFIMPMLILAIRVHVDIHFRNSYTLFFSIPDQHNLAYAKINVLLTKLLDPNIYFSRFSFFESGREGVNLVYKKNLIKKGPRMIGKYYTTSSLISTLLPEPSEGKIRALFTRKKDLQEQRGMSKIGQTIMAAHTLKAKSSQDTTLTKANRSLLFEVAFEKVNLNMKKRSIKPIFKLPKKYT